MRLLILEPCRSDTDRLAGYHLLGPRDRIVPVSNWVRSRLEPYVAFPEAIVPVPNGVDVDSFRPIDRDDSRIRLARQLGSTAAAGETIRRVVGLLEGLQPHPTASDGMSDSRAAERAGERRGQTRKSDEDPSGL